MIETTPDGPAATDTALSGAVGAPGRKVRWLKRIGVAGFLFFFVKGLLWLLVPAAYFAYKAIAKA